tara:strand:- start:114 stop:557 length:444 start_codon:yes stop_codon:yes gene_type:complete
LSLSNKLKEIIDEIINEEEIEEASTTANVPGYQTPYAFTGDDEESKKKKEKNATASTGYKMVKEIYNQNYRTFKKDESKNSRQKVNGAIKEINKRLFEIERIIGRAAKLKREAGVSTDNYWKPTRPRLKKIAERLIKVSNKLTEIAS